MMAFITPFSHTKVSSFISDKKPISHNLSTTKNLNRSSSRFLTKRCNRTTMIAPSPSETTPSQKFSPRGMGVDDFFTRSLGQWRSQRSSHNLVWAQFEAITSEITIESLTCDHADVLKLCEQNKISPQETALSFSMSWEGETDWDDEDDSQLLQGESVMALIKDSENHGRLLRSSGYAETIPAVGHWRMTDEGVFILETFYDSAAAEERIWFATPDLRMRVSQIRTSSGNGVVTASFSTEIRRITAE